MVGIVLALVMRGDLHRRRRRGHQPVQLGLLHLRRSSWSTRRSSWPRRATNDDDEYEENRLVKWVETHLPATDEWHGVKILVQENGKRLITPMFIVVLALGTTDLLFALDSIPAIYGLTKEPYLVLTANIFALMGLRQLYFLIGGLLQRLVYLSYGLAFLLGFIGVKLILHAMHENELPFINGGEPIEWAPDIPIWLSLVVIVGILAVTDRGQPDVGEVQERPRGRLTCRARDVPGHRRHGLPRLAPRAPPARGGPPGQGAHPRRGEGRDP